jgi:hypothetical protein
VSLTAREAQGDVLNALVRKIVAHPISGLHGVKACRLHQARPSLEINGLPTAAPGDRLGRSAGDPTPVDNHVEVKLYHEWQVVEEKMFIGAVRIEASSGAIQQARDVALGKVTHV